MSEDRRQDDARIDEIKSSVHRIDQSLAHLGDRFDKQDSRMTDTERAVMRVQAEHDALKLVMAADNSRLGEKIDGVRDSVTRDVGAIRTTMDNHLKSEEGFQRKTLFFLATILVSVVGTIGWSLFTKAMEQGAP